ncbi:hypothetical protein C8R47DRAFT_1084912 [Mycena vitilis]|nr:hypothetical protein C8R47DRAFT_1085192 [Mycena vitilis]KAJ6448793.1 hypothetical protein C8R47DRAFT_1084912 [Mycena vitilis]
MTFTNIGVCPYLSPLVLVSSVGLAKQRAEATAFPMVHRLRELHSRLQDASGLKQRHISPMHEKRGAAGEGTKEWPRNNPDLRTLQNGDSDDAPPYPGAPIPTAERLFEATRAPWTGDYRRYIPQHREPGTGCLCTKYVYPFLLLTWVAITSQPCSSPRPTTIDWLPRVRATVYLAAPSRVAATGGCDKTCRLHSTRNGL